MEAPKKKILIVDDEKNFLRSLKDTLELEGYKVLTGDDGKAALQILQQKTVDAVITDIRMPQMSGMELLQNIRQKYPFLKVFIITGYGSIQDAVKSIKMGAENYILKPIDVRDLLQNIRRSLDQTKENQAKNTLISDTMSFIGQTEAMQNVRKLIKKVASSDLPVLIVGESGTGKELVANAIFQNSNRAKRSFLKINCAAVPDHLLESELFGFEAGAFTDAKKMKKGKLELAHHGTLFLDEIGDMPFAMQVKLLRVLEEKKVERLGGNSLVDTDFRLISATNQNLPELIKKDEFRKDLYFRLNTIVIRLPPLREIVEDIPLLSEFFLQNYCAEHHIDCPKIHPLTMEKLLQYHWHGNVRELRNVIHRAIVLSNGHEILPQHLPESGNQNKEDTDNNPESLSLEEMEREHIKRVLKITKGNKNRTASILNIHRDTLYRKMKKYKLTYS